jgi:hypothetical protein
MIFGVGSSIPACAEMDAKTLIEIHQKAPASAREEIEIRVGLVEAGLALANAELTQIQKTTAIYCSPRQMALTGSQLIDIVRRAVSDKPFLGDQPYGVVLLVSLKQLFPCSPQSK